MNNRHEVIKRVVLTPKRENAEFRTEYTDREWHLDEWISGGEPEYIFDSYSWDLMVEIGKSEKFMKVAAIVGDDKAREVLDALGV